MPFFNPFRRTPPTREAFARLFQKALRKAGYRDRLDYDADRYMLTLAGEHANIVNLQNFYADYCNTPPGARKVLLKHLIEPLLTPDRMPDDLSEARSHLRPKVYARAGIELMKLDARMVSTKHEFTIPLYELGSHLVVGLAYDLPHSIKSVNKDDLERWGISYYEGMEIAKENLEEQSLTVAQIGDGVFAFINADNYDSSRIVLTDRIRSLPVKGEHVAMAANRDTLLITGSDDVDGLAIMADLAEKAIGEQSRPLSGIPLRLDGDEWVDWRVPRSHPHFQRFKRLELALFQDIYNEQGAALERVAEGDNPPFVASFTVIEENQTGRRLSYSVWGQGIESWLPRTDLVAFVAADAELVGGGKLVAGNTWEQVEQVAGHLMAPVEDMYPPRYRVSEFPSHAELEAIGLCDQLRLRRQDDG